MTLFCVGAFMYTTAATLPLKRIVSSPSCMHANAASRAGSHDRLESVGDLYGACPAMRKLFAAINRIAPTLATAMILGESGSGKELVARAIHNASPRRSGPFVAVNCGALPENLIESELFGHERGSFTGATRTHRGCFERANHGTLFLDEVVEMPVDLQVRLLRVLETGRYSRVGGDAELSADIRVIAASNRDLRSAVASGRLREDLMYRLCVIPVVVPALRERKGDALLLAEMFLDELNREHGTVKVFTAEARAKIAQHHWPGNVRELRNIVHRSFVLSDDAVDVDLAQALVPDHGAEPSHGCDSGDTSIAAGDTIAIPIGTSLDDAERALILATLNAVGGSKVKAAQMLGISLKTLYNRLQAYRNAAGDGSTTPTKRLVLVEAA
jgi:DNA-binding NtrC family response regulator